MSPPAPSFATHGYSSQRAEGASPSLSAAPVCVLLAAHPQLGLILCPPSPVHCIPLMGVEAEGSWKFRALSGGWPSQGTQLQASLEGSRALCQLAWPWDWPERSFVRWALHTLGTFTWTYALRSLTAGSRGRGGIDTQGSRWLLEGVTEQN